MPGPCSRKLATPICESSVPNASTNASRSAARPSDERHRQAAVDDPLAQGLGDDGAAGDLGGEGQRPLERVALDDLVGEADAQRFLGGDLTARDAQLLGPARPDQPGEPLRTATARNDAEEDLRLPEHGAFAGDAIVARQRQLAATAERVAADGGDHEAVEGGDGVVRGMERVGDGAGLLLTAELIDVGAGGEDPLTAGHHDSARQLGSQLVDRLVQLAEQGGRQRVDLAVAQRDDGDAVITSFECQQLVHRPESDSWDAVRSDRE